jgi:anti-sigma regulatory factor (Ser/Thr protein kinase)
MKSTLAADISAPGHARAFVADQLESAPVPQGVLIDKVVLTASELVTNAVQAGASAIEVTVRVSPRRLNLVVTDDAEGWPTPTSAAMDDTTGRGLSIVDQLTDSWDVTAHKRGKAVTATWFRR